MEGETLSDYSSQSDIGLTDNDDDRLALSKRTLRLDILGLSQNSINKGGYTDDSYMSALVVADEYDLLKDLVAYQFLSLLFQDSSINSRGRGSEKHQYYYFLYTNTLKPTVNVLLGKLTPMQSPNRIRLVGYFG